MAATRQYAHQHEIKSFGKASLLRGLNIDQIPPSRMVELEFWPVLSVHVFSSFFMPTDRIHCYHPPLQT